MHITGDFLNAIFMVNAFFSQVKRSDTSANIIVSCDGIDIIVAAGTLDGSRKAIYKIPAPVAEECKWLLDASVAVPLLKRFEGGEIVENEKGVLTLTKGKRAAIITSKYGADIENTLETYLAFMTKLSKKAPFVLKMGNFIEGLQSVLYAADAEGKPSNAVVIRKDQNAAQELLFEAYDSYKAARCKELLEAETALNRLVLPRWQAEYLVRNKWTNEDVSLYDTGRTITVQADNILISSLKLTSENALRNLDEGKNGKSFFDFSDHKFFYFSKADLLDFLGTVDVGIKSGKGSGYQCLEFLYNKANPMVVTLLYRSGLVEVTDEIPLKSDPNAEQLRIGISPTILKASLEDIGDEVGIALCSPMGTIGITDANKPNLTRMFMPVRLK